MNCAEVISFGRAVQTSMGRTFAAMLSVLALALFTCAQDGVPIFKTEAASAFVWGEDTLPGTVSSSARDPVTGNIIHKLNHEGVEVISQAGFERISSEQAGELLSFTVTVVNNTLFDLSVGQGRASIDGRVVLLLPVVLTKKELSKRQRNQVWDLASMSCFSSGFLPHEAFLSPNAPSKLFTATPKRALTVSFIIKDPRYSPVLCSLEGCYPKGIIRFSIAINTTDFVFSWAGRDMVNCGK